MPFLSYTHEARDTFYKQHDPAKAEQQLRQFLSTPESLEEKRAVYELMGLILRSQKRFSDAAALYEKINDHYQAGYCALLQANVPQVQAHWSKLLAQHQNHWCVSLYGLVTQQLRTYPTLFQIRNHIECDIANLIAAGRLDYLENLLSYVEFLTQINLETPKFAGRALMHAGWLERAGSFLIQGQKALPNDPEIYFHLGQYSMALQHYSEAGLMLKQCLLISPTYRPAAELLNQIPEQAQHG
jgi:tetratricopeptide (TPR) repeat protein